MRRLALCLGLLGLCLAAFAADAQSPAPSAKAPPPAGWSYLPELGAKDIFKLLDPPPSGPAPQMQARTVSDVGILQKAVDAPLTEATRLAWTWRMLALPSAAAEDVAAAHDYFSIAVKFDNGQDLTYMWSAALPTETAFRCPLRNWKDRETHVVVRSGSGERNRWLREERDVLADYKAFVGGPPPGRITHVWLIANSTIQKGRGEMDFANISLRGQGRRIKVL